MTALTFLKQTTVIPGIPRRKACSWNSFITGTHTHTENVRGSGIIYWYLPLPHDFTCPQAESLCLERRGTAVMQNEGLVTASNGSKSWSRKLSLTAICQQKLHHLVWFRYILLCISHRVGPVSAQWPCYNWIHIIWIITICGQSTSWPIVWKNKFTPAGRRW